MGLKEKLARRRVRAKMPSWWSVNALQYSKGLQYHIALDAFARGSEGIGQMKSLSNSVPADIDSLKRAVHSIVDLATELEEVDQELRRMSIWEMDGLLDDSRLVLSVESHWSHGAKCEIAYDQIDLVEEAEVLSHWAAQHIPTPADKEMILLIERRLEIRQALFQAHQSLQRTSADLEQASQKLRRWDASMNADADAGQDATPELTLDRADEVESRTGAISAGLDEAFAGDFGDRPEIGVLDRPAPGIFSRQPPAAEIER